MTAGERLRELAGVGGTAAALLLLIGNGATAGEALVDYSGQTGITAAEHLLTDRVQHAIPGGGEDFPLLSYRHLNQPGITQQASIQAKRAPSSGVELTPEDLFPTKKSGKELADVVAEAADKQHGEKGRLSQAMAKAAQEAGDRRRESQERIESAEAAYREEQQEIEEVTLLMLMFMED